MIEEEKLIEWVKEKLPELVRTDEAFRTMLLGVLVQYLPTREEFTEILKRLERIERELARLRKEQSALRKDFRAMQQALLEQGQAIRELQQVVAEQGRAIAEQGQAIRELQQVVAEQGRAIAEQGRAIAEQGQAIRELQQVVVEQGRAIAEQGQAIRELQQAVVEQGRAIAEQGQAIRELQRTVAEQGEAVRGLREDFTRLERRVDVGFARFGILSEEILRRSLQVAIENWLKAGRVHSMELAGRQVDVVIRDSEHVILEVTARAHLQDIDKLKMAARDYEQRFGITPRLAIACAYITPLVVERLKEEGIELISAEVPE